jgi:copper chaperone CopZ
MLKTTLKIDGMMCGMCEAHVCDAIRKAMPKASKVKASHVKKEASFVTEDKADEDLIRSKIDETGYKVLDIRTEEYKRFSLFGK